MKKFLLSIVALAATFTASAQFTTDVENLKIASGETKSVTFSLKTTEEVSGYEIWLNLPDGIEVVYDDEEEDYIVLSSRHVKSHAATDDYKAGSKTEFLISVASNKSANLKELEGEIFTISFKATKEVKSPIGVKNSFAATAAGKKISFDDFDIKVNDENAITSVSADKAKKGAIYNIAGQRVSKATKGIYVVDGKKVAVK